VQGVVLGSSTSRRTVSTPSVWTSMTRPSTCRDRSGEGCALSGCAAVGRPRIWAVGCPVAGIRRSGSPRASVRRVEEMLRWRSRIRGYRRRGAGHDVGRSDRRCGRGQVPRRPIRVRCQEPPTVTGTLPVGRRTGVAGCQARAGYRVRCRRLSVDCCGRRCVGTPATVRGVHRLRWWWGR